MSEGDRKFLIAYLKYYQEGAFAVLRGDQPKPRANNESEVISDIPLVPLTTKALRQPCLSLPSKLSHKHRKAVHEICTDLGLYHASFGKWKQGRRYVAVSIYYDGFRHIPGFGDKEGRQKENDFVLQTVAKFRPWILQRGREGGHDPDAITRENRDSILELIDQPGKCLRDGLDVLNFEELESQDLSQTTPPSFEDEGWFLVDTPEKMKLCVQRISDSHPTEVAFDLECYNQSKYVQVTCLIQLATSSGLEYVIDPLAPGVWDTISLLAPIFASKDIVKIGHSIGGLDVRSLHRDFGIFVVNAFDTYEAARCLGVSRKGLASLCKHYGLPNCQAYESLKAQYQTTDWTRRPLTEPMIRYGRYDVHYLIQLRKLMMRDLTKSQLNEKRHRNPEAELVRDAMTAMMKNFDEDDEIFLDASSDCATLNDDASSYEEAMEEEVTEETQALLTSSELRMNLDLMRVISRSQDRCLDLWTESSEPAMRNPDFQAHLVRSKRDGDEWSSSQIRLYKSLADWREVVAKERGCSAEIICPLGFLASVAFKRPTHVLGLRRISFDLPGMLENIGTLWDELFERVRKSRVEDGLDEFEQIAQFPSFTELDKSIVASRRGRVIDSSTTWGILSCAAIIAGMAIMYSRRPGVRR